jgi:ribosomal protein L40E
LLVVVVLWLRKNGYWIVFSCFVIQQIMYKGKCAECNAHWHSNAFKSRRAGFALPVANERRLVFAFESEQNNKICRACYLKNHKASKHSGNDRRSEGESGVKKAKTEENDADENANIDVEEIEVQENVDVTEKEGTAISVLLRLSKL